MDYQSLPLDLVAGPPGLPFPVYLKREGRMILYANPGADLAATLGRANADLEVHIPATDIAAMRRLLVLLLARTLGSRSEAVVERGRRAADFAVTLLSPLFGPERSIAPEAFVAGQAAVDLLSSALAREPALGRALIGGHRLGATAGEPRTRNDASTPADARQYAGQALDGLACAIAIATALAPDGSRLEGTTLLELGRGVTFRDLGLPRLAAAAAGRRSRSMGVGAGVQVGHPALAVRLISGALGWQPAWTTLVAGHHERLDGSGYPAGMVGADLAVATRIAGLADTFASLVAPAAWGHVRAADEAISVLRLGTNARFGDDLVLALVRVLQDGQLLPPHRTGAGAMTH